MTREQALDAMVAAQTATKEPHPASGIRYGSALRLAELEALGLLRLEEAGDKFSALIREAPRVEWSQFDYPKLVRGSWRDTPRDPSAIA